MSKRSGWWSVAQSAMVGAVLVVMAFRGGHEGSLWVGFVAAAANAVVYGIGELLNQSSDDLRAHAMELLRLNEKDDAR